MKVKILAKIFNYTTRPRMSLFNIWEKTPTLKLWRRKNTHKISISRKNALWRYIRIYCTRKIAHKGCTEGIALAKFLIKRKTLTKIVHEEKRSQELNMWKICIWKNEEKDMNIRKTLTKFVYGENADKICIWWKRSQNGYMRK